MKAEGLVANDCRGRIVVAADWVTWASGLPGNSEPRKWRPRQSHPWPTRPLIDLWLAPLAVSDNSQRFVNELVAMISRLSPVSVVPQHRTKATTAEPSSGYGTFQGCDRGRQPTRLEIHHRLLAA